jgi:hypothetical protein
MNALCARTENKVSITFFSDPSSGAKVEASNGSVMRGDGKSLFATIATILLLATPVFAVELFRYRGAAN